jgi:membrane associated rhomboid family serine protease
VNSKEGRPILTYVIIVVSVIVMIHATITSASSLLYDEYALRASYFTHGMRVISIVTYMFIHSDWIHLILNCFALWGVGTIMEREIGSARFGIVFLTSGVISGLEHVILNPASTEVFVGASGAVFGALATLFLLSPFKRTSLFVVPLPAMLVGVLIASIELASVAWASGGVLANDVQIAGFVTGAALSFWIDTKKAIKGLAIGAGVVIILYMFGLFFNLI